MTLTFLKSERVIALLENERAVDGLRWIAAFIAVLSTYGVAAWMVLRPTGSPLDVNAPVVEINLRDLPQPSATAPSDRASEPALPQIPRVTMPKVSSLALPTRLREARAGLRAL